MPHSPEVAEAIEKSIQHWQKNLVAEYHHQTSVWASDCALCSLFSGESRDYSCEGCPVRDRTGKEQCYGSPYYSACSALAAWGVSNSDRDRDVWRHQCQKEIAFLESLRDLPTE